MWILFQRRLVISESQSVAALPAPSLASGNVPTMHRAHSGVWKRFFASIHDMGMAGVALYLALVARYGFDRLPDDGRVVLWIGSFMLIAAIVFRLFGLGRGIWRFASVTDLRAIVLASTVAVIAFLFFAFLVQRLEGLPRTAPITTWFAMIVLIGAPRLAYRALKDGGLTIHFRPGDPTPDGIENILLIGNVKDADRVIRTYGLESSRRYRVRGIIDYGPQKRGREVRGIPILGDLSELDTIVARLRRNGVPIDVAVMTTAHPPREHMQSLAGIVARLALPLRRLDPIPLTSSEPDLTTITLEDLLGRAPVRLELDNIHSLITDRVVLITGAGGSIGAEITRQVASHGPSRLVLLDSSEYALYEIDQSVGHDHSSCPRRAIIADVRDRARLATIFRDERPSLVFHAAALKHVPLVEANPCEGVLTNVIGTRNVADAATDIGADAVVMISTDKAIRPTSVMGATKRAAEAYCQSLDVSEPHTRFITVRFGNVLGSTGSVAPLFRRQIESGGPVTVTDPEMRRYFMTIKEATELVLQAAATGIDRSDHRGRICVLDMGAPVKIVDLARTMIALAGLRPEIDIPIVFTGLRPGEKLFEELFEADEATLPSGADGVFVATARLLERADVTSVLDLLEQAAMSGDNEAVRRHLAILAPHFASGPGSPAGAVAAKIVPIRRSGNS